MRVNGPVSGGGLRGDLGSTTFRELGALLYASPSVKIYGRAPCNFRIARNPPGNHINTNPHQIPTLHNRPQFSPAAQAAGQSWRGSYCALCGTLVREANLPIQWRGTTVSREVSLDLPALFRSRAFCRRHFLFRAR